MAETKVCRKCGVEKDRSEFSKNSAVKDGLRSECKECGKAYRKLKFLKEHPDYKEPKPVPKGEKRCPKCSKIMYISEFNKNRTQKDGLSSWCKQCDREYYYRNREKRIEKDKEYRKKTRPKRKIYEIEYRAKNKDGLREYHEKYHEKNKEKIRAWRKEYREKNREKIRQKNKEYREKNKELIHQKNQEYRERKRETILIKHRQYNIQNIDKIKEARLYRASYKTYASQLTVDELPKLGEDGFMLVRCTYCGRYFYPTQSAVAKRIDSLKGRGWGEARLYCSDGCKKACPVFNQVLYPKDQKPATSREVQPELRQMRLACDEYSCQRCGKTIDEAQLHCHHIEGVEQNPIESADVDICITLCKKCHKWAHTQEGCRYFELRCE